MWNTLSTTSLRPQLLLLDSLYQLISTSINFLGISVSAEFCLLLIEMSYQSNSLELSKSIKIYIQKFWNNIKPSIWLDMQSVFIQVSLQFIIILFYF